MTSMFLGKGMEVSPGVIETWRCLVHISETLPFVISGVVSHLRVVPC